MYNMKKTTGAILFLLTISSVVLADSSFECLDNTTLEREYNYSITIDGVNQNITVTKNMDCMYGCDNVTNTCDPNPVDRTVYFGVLVMVLLFCMVWIIRVFT